LQSRNTKARKAAALTVKKCKEGGFYSLVGFIHGRISVIGWIPLFSGKQSVLVNNLLFYVAKDQTLVPPLRTLQATFSAVRMKFYQDGEKMLKIF